MAAEVVKPNCKRQAWFCTARLPSDIVIEVDDTSFHLHKFPLMSKSSKLHKLIIEKEAKTRLRQQQEQTQEGEHEIEEEVDEDDHLTQICLLDFPGGTKAFETAAKFCYGVKISLSSSNVAQLRCAAEYLEMKEEYSENNLISKTKQFLSQSVFKNVKESIKVLKSCEPGLPLAENLGIVQNCIDSVASMASSADLTLFNELQSSSTATLQNEIENGLRRKKSSRENKSESWFTDLARLSPPMFNRLILAMRRRDLNPEIIGTCLMYFAQRQIPGISRSSRKPSSASAASESEQRELLETIIASLPQGKSVRSEASTRFLFGLLRTANILNASESCKAALEKKIGSQLEQATLDDLLIPTYSCINETLYDVDCVERILSYFLDELEETNATGIEAESGDYSNSLRSPALMTVGKLIDDYLSEIASDANLKPEKFYNLALSLPDQARLIDDGLYRAVDLYLEAHPWLQESEREKICEVMDCQKLTLEACTHATQNERLPLRAVVQVLFFEQLQLRHAITATLLAEETTPIDPGRLSAVMRIDDAEEEGVTAPCAEKGNDRWETTARENQVLQLDLDSMRTRVHQLEKECSTMKQVIVTVENGGPRRGWRESLSKRFGCKMNMLGCDSFEPTAVETRKLKNHHQH